MLLTRHFDELWLYTIASAHVGAVVLLVAYAISTMQSVLGGLITGPKYCAKLNSWMSFRILLQCFNALFLFMHGHYVLFSYDALILKSRVVQVIRQRMNVYDADKSRQRKVIFEHMWDHFTDVFYLGISAGIYWVRLHQAIRTTTDWPLLLEGSFLSEMFFYSSVTVLTYATMAVLAHIIMTTDELELTKVEWQGAFCKKLNFWLPIKILIHAALSSVLLGYGCWLLAAPNLIILIFEIRASTQVRDSTIGVYDPEDMKKPENINAIRKKSKLQFGFFAGFICVFAMSMVLELLKPLTVTLHTRLLTTTIVGGVLIIPPTLSFVALRVLRKRTDCPAEAVAKFCTFLKAMQYTTAIIYMQLCGFFLMHKEWYLLMYNGPVLCVAVALMFLRDYKTSYLQDNDGQRKHMSYCKWQAIIYLVYTVIYVINIVAAHEEVPEPATLMDIILDYYHMFLDKKTYVYFNNFVHFVW